MLSSVKNNAVLRTLAAVLLLISTTACGSSKVTMEEIDGVLHVTNPDEALRPNMTIGFEELFRIGGDEMAGEEYLFSYIGGIVTGEDHHTFVQVMGEDIIKVFDDEGRYVRTIGRQGQGPGELAYAQGVGFGPDGNLWVPSRGSLRIVIFTTDGDFVKNIPFSLMPPMNIQTTADGFMGLHVDTRPLGGTMLEMDFLLRRFDASGDTLNTLSKSTFEVDYLDMQMGKYIENAPLFTQDHEGRVWQCRPRTDIYRLNVWNPDGTLSMVVEKDVPVMPKSAEEIEEERELVLGIIQQQTSGQMPEGIDFSYDPDPNRPFLGYPSCDPEGLIWVQAGLKDSFDGNAFDLYDERGRFLQRIVIEGVVVPTYLQFVDDRLYVAELDPEGIPQVIAYRVTR
ncbi:6-bladed beta-propeller [Gemmatimonadota bacterium]